jgi:hypothetical protein
MSIVITYQNIEELIFCDEELQNKLPEFKGYFNTWMFAVKQPSLKMTAQKSLIEVLRRLHNEKCVKILKEHFATEDVVIEQIDSGIVYNLSFPLNEAENLLNAMPTVLKESYFIYRDDDTLYISLWR